MSDKLPENKLTIRNSTAEFLIFTQQAGENAIPLIVFYKHLPLEAEIGIYDALKNRFNRID